jgi:cell wall-associated NlpC family hydrolase
MPSATLAEVLNRFNIDDRLTLCDVWQKSDGSIAGFVEMPQYRDVLKAAGFDVSKVKLMPEEGSTTDRFGIVAVDHAILRKFPKDQPGDRDNATDVMRGETCWILDRKADGMTLVHTSDGYLGWTESKTFGWLFDAEKFQVILERKHDAAAAMAERSSAIMPRTSTSAIGGEPFGFRSPGQLIVDGPTTRPSTPLGVTPAEDRAMHARELREWVCNDASRLLGTPYLWGGKSAEGIDCSGLVQTSFARNNILLPRDAYQQANVGQLVATRWFKDALLPADLLFFISGKHGNVSHVAIYLGDGRYIEAAGKDVHIRSMTPGDPDYDAERTATFAWARRVIE